MVDLDKRRTLFGLGALGLSSLIGRKALAFDEEISKIAVVSDLEGALDNVEKSVNKIKKEGVQLIIIAGDCYENEELRGNRSLYPNSRDNYSEMINCIKPYAELKIPVFVIPGNHEVKTIYNKAIKKLQENYHNVEEVSDKLIEFPSFSIVTIGGYHHPRFTATGGFLISNSQYQLTFQNLQKASKREKPVLFISHGPPYTNSNIDKIIQGMNVGDKVFTQIMMMPEIKNILHIFGHIHEAGGNFFNFSEDKTSINTAAITNYLSDKSVRGTIVEIKDNKAIWKLM